MITPGADVRRISTPVIENTRLTEKYFRLSIQVPDLAAHARPGQFLMIKPDRRYHPLLLRPFSIHRILPGGIIQLFIRYSGLGTNLLSEMQPGDTLEVLGPLGNGFSIPSDLETGLIIAGGMGIAPFPALVEAIKKLSPKAAIHLFFGTKARHELNCLELFQELGCQMYITTEDGSFGVSGIISQLFEKFLHETRLHRMTAAFACGPFPMLYRVNNLAAEYKLSLQVSLESHMACGIGSCLGCPVKILSENRESAVPWTYQRVCHEGPVFEARRIVWEN